MLPAILRMIVPAVSDDREHAAPRAGNPLPGDSPWDRRSRGRRVSGGCGAGCPALVGRSPHDAPPHPFTRSPPAGSSPGRTVRRVPRVRYVTVSNCLVVLTNTEQKTRHQERRKAGGSRYRRPANRRVRSTPRHAACSGSRGSALALVWVERHDRPRPLAGGPSPSRSLPRTRRHALHAAPSPAKPTISSPRWRPTPTGSRPVRHLGIRRSAASRDRHGRPGRPVQAGPQGP